LRIAFLKVVKGSSTVTVLLSMPFLIVNHITLAWKLVQIFFRHPNPKAKEQRWATKIETIENCSCKTLIVYLWEEWLYEGFSWSSALQHSYCTYSGSIFSSSKEIVISNSHITFNVTYHTLELLPLWPCVISFSIHRVLKW
jgi:hypothetical protein